MRQRPLSRGVACLPVAAGMVAWLFGNPQAVWLGLELFNEAGPTWPESLLRRATGHLDDKLPEPSRRLALERILTCNAPEALQQQALSRFAAMLPGPLAVVSLLAELTATHGARPLFNRQREQENKRELTCPKCGESEPLASLQEHAWAPLIGWLSKRANGARLGR